MGKSGACMTSSLASWSFGGSEVISSALFPRTASRRLRIWWRVGDGVSSGARDAPQFYLTAPSACPYLPGQQERKIFTHLVGKRAAPLNDLLTQTGFRRSQTIAYRPACESCRACVSVRVLVDHFRPSESQRRAKRANPDVVGTFVAPKPTSEHYSLFRSYLDARHPEGGMAEMSSLGFALMVEDTHIDTVLTEYRARI